MPPVNLCPEPNAYQRLIHGELPPPDVERLSQHLAGCSSCAAAVQTLLGADTLLSALRSRTVDAPPLPESVPADLTRRLLALRLSSDPSSDPWLTLQALTPPQASDEIGRLAHYRVLKVLGEGGMGVVFLAEDTLLGRTVALKTMKPAIAADPRHRQRFLREARAAAKVESDNIVPIYGVGEDRGVPWLAMPLLKGQSLDELLKRLKVLKPAQAVRLGAQVAKGLAAAHAAGLIHRDVKPANIWVEPECGGRARLLDFGLARDDREGGEHLTRPGAVLGTPAFMAPEQARGEPLDARADLFSLGCVLYWAVTGRLPFQGEGAMSVLLALATQTPPAPHQVNPDVPRPLSALIVNLLAKDRSLRPASAATVAAALQAMQETSTGTVPIAKPVASPATARAEPNPWADLTEVAETAAPAPVAAPRSRWRLATAAALLLALGGALAAGIVVIIKNKDGKEVGRVPVPDGGSAEIKADGGGKPRADSGKVDPERRAAEWVLSLGGKVYVNNEPKAGTKLPKERFVVTGVDLADNQKVTDAGLVNLKECCGLWLLNLSGTPITDAGLAHLKEYVSGKLLTELYLWNTPVTDAGLAHLRHCTNLRQIQLPGTAVTDAGLAHLKESKNLRYLWLHKTKVTAAGVQKLAAALPLCRIAWDGGVIEPPAAADRRAAEWVLSIGGTVKVRQGGEEREIKAAKDLPAAAFDLFEVDLRDKRKVDDAELVHLEGLTNLTRLILHGTQVGNAGLEHLKGLPRLTSLSLGGTPVSDAGLEHLKGLGKLTELWLGSTRVSDDGLVHLKKLTNLTILGLFNTRVGDAGLQHLKELTNLGDLHLDGTLVSDAGLVHLKGLTNLGGLFLSSTRVSDAGLEHLKGLTKLGTLWLNRTKVSDAGLKHLKELTNLMGLRLNGTSVSDAGLKHLAGLRSLLDLDLTGTQVTADGIAALQKALPQCKITWDGNAKK